MPRELTPKDFPSYDKMCRLTDDFIKIKHEEDKKKKTTKYQYMNDGRYDNEKGKF